MKREVLDRQYENTIWDTNSGISAEELEQKVVELS